MSGCFRWDFALRTGQDRVWDSWFTPTLTRLESWLAVNPKWFVIDYFHHVGAQHGGRVQYNTSGRGSVATLLYPEYIIGSESSALVFNLIWNTAYKLKPQFFSKNGLKPISSNQIRFCVIDLFNQPIKICSTCADASSVANEMLGNRFLAQCPALSLVSFVVCASTLCACGGFLNPNLS